MRRGALLLLVCVGAMGFLAAPALAAGDQPVLTGALNNASPGLPAGSAGTGMDAGPLSQVQDVAVSGGYGYLPSYFNGTLSAVDLSNANAPAIDALSSIGTVPSNGTEVVGADTVKVFNGVAYVVSKNLNASTSNNDIGVGNSLTMFDVSAQYAGSPMYLGSYTDANKLFGAYGVAVASSGGQTYAYVVAQGCLSSPQPCPNGGVGNNFVVLNVTNPASPTYVTEIHNSSTGAWPNALDHPTAVVISGNYAYVTSFYGAQVAVIDISNPVSPQIVATIRNDANNDVVFPNDLAISGHYLLIANQGTDGPMAVVDISNPTSPTIVGSISAPSLQSAYRIAVYGDFAYLAGLSANTVSAIDISNPQAPRLAGSVTDNTNLYRTSGVDVMPTSGGLYVIAAAGRQPGEVNDLYPPYPPGITSYPPSPPFSFGSSGNTDNTGTVATIQVDPVPNSVTISPSSEPPSQTNQTTASFSFSTADAVATVACSLDGASFGPCTTATTMSYTGLAAGSHTFTVQSTGASGTTTSDQYSWTVGAQAGPPGNTTTTQTTSTPTTSTPTTSTPTTAGTPTTVSTGAPTVKVRPGVTGTMSVGQTVSADHGTWSGTGIRYTYAWSRCAAIGSSCHAITGATRAVYRTVAADAGRRLMVKVTATHGGGSATATSARTAIIARRSVSLAVEVTAASGRNVGRSGTLVVSVRSRVSALIGAYALIKIGGTSFVTKRVTGQSAAGRALRVTLRLTSAQSSQLRAGLAHGIVVTARVYPVRASAPPRSVAIGVYRKIRIIS